MTVYLYPVSSTKEIKLHPADAARTRMKPPALLRPRRFSKIERATVIAAVRRQPR